MIPSKFLIVLMLLLVSLATPLSSADELRRRGLFGVRLTPVTEKNFEQLGLERPSGVVISSTIDDTPAAGAGIQANDVIVKLNGRDVPDLAAFFAVARTLYGGDTAKLTIVRNGQTLTKSFELIRKTTESSPDFDVIYDFVKVGDIRLRTIITRPKSTGRHPAMLFIQDLTSQSVDWFLPALKSPFRPLIYGIAANGVVTMRVEPSGVGDSEGPAARDADFSTQVDWFKAAARKLKNYDFVNPKNVVIFGYKFGGIAAPLAAADAKVRGVAVYGTMSRTWLESRLANSRRHQELEGIEEDAIDETMAGLERVLKAICVAKKPAEEVRRAFPDQAGLLSQLVGSNGAVLGRSPRFFHQLAGMDLGASWKLVEGDILAIWGGSDWTSCREDAEQVRKIVNETGSARALFLEIPGIDHLFSHAEDMEESYLVGTQFREFNGMIVDELTRWIKSLSEKPGDS